MLHEIGLSKTGTLTKGELSVKRFHIDYQKKAIENSSPTFFNQELELKDEIKKMIVENIISNTDVRIEIMPEGNTYQYQPRGSAIEESCIKFLIDNEENVQMKF